MAFDKYVLETLFLSYKALWGLWLCQFCSKVGFFFSAFQDYFDPIYMPSTSFYWDCTAGRWMWPRKRLSWALELLSICLGAPSWWQLGTSSPFLCLLLVIELGSAQWSGPDETFLQRHSIPVRLWDWEGHYLGTGAKQSVIWCIWDLTGHFPLPWKSLWWESQQ